MNNFIRICYKKMILTSVLFTVVMLVIPLVLSSSFPVIVRVISTTVLLILMSSQVHGISQLSRVMFNFKRTMFNKLFLYIVCEISIIFTGFVNSYLITQFELLPALCASTLLCIGVPVISISIMQYARSVDIETHNTTEMLFIEE